MGRLFIAAVNTYLQHDAAVATAPPLTFAAWAYPDTTGLRHTAVSIGASGSNHAIFLDINSTNVVRAVEIDGAQGAASTTASVTVNTWQHLCGTFTAVNDRAVYLDGANKGTDATSITPTGLDRTAIGRRVQSSPSNYFSGRLAEVAIWNEVLTDAEVARLALQRLAAPYVRPWALIGYWPVWGHNKPEIDMSAFARHMTVNGTTVTEGPPGLVPFPRRVYVPSLRF